MASVFTYETEPVTFASPWPQQVGGKHSDRERQRLHNLCGLRMPCTASLTDYEIEKLDAEPQEGPIEYKLHLLLRPRRSFTSSSTVRKVSGSHLSKSKSALSSSSISSRSGTSSPGLAPSAHTRQNRLQHLTTQLLWRLQQSSPQHASSKCELNLPILPDPDIALSALSGPEPLVAGLEESQGALYEIGVSDDGTLVGLALDELEESLQVLRAMAYSIGCSLKILKTVVVGSCQWEEGAESNVKALDRLKIDRLWVAEVLVGPWLEAMRSVENDTRRATSGSNGHPETEGRSLTHTKNRMVQLRVSLTGSTTSGKSSLLGTLSTTTLDNGRGKSRLSLLRHRHEIVSGVTSSLAQELIGYHDLHPPPVGSTATNIINYASGNTSSWTDIHSSCDPGRLVFLTDSAGHPKFRRTTVRGLISWAPHWTFCCIAADDDEDSSGRIGATVSTSDVLGFSALGMDLSKAHLELCLKLDLPLVCVITKLDLASKSGLRHTVAKVLSTIKLAGRKPALLPGTAPNAGTVDCQGLPLADENAVRSILDSVTLPECNRIVPIVLTSASTGAGIGQLHSLLHQLPVIDTLLGTAHQGYVNVPAANDLSTVFHVDEIFAVGESRDKSQAAIQDHMRPRFILSGYLRYGSIQTGDNVLLGPFFSESSIKSASSQAHRSKSFPGLSKSLPQDLAVYASIHNIPEPPLLDTFRDDAHRQQNPAVIWQTVRITSLRHLRLPVRRLSEGQVGTIAISSRETLYTNAEPCLRRGMVICTPRHLSSVPPAYRLITAVFADPNIYVNPGSTVTVYTASIRAPAKIVEVSVPEGCSANEDKADTDLFAFEGTIERDEDAEAGAKDATAIKEIEITFRFTHSVEWVELGTKALVTPASGISMLSPPPRDAPAEGGMGGSAAAGLDGFVGRIVSASA